MTTDSTTATQLTTEPALGPQFYEQTWDLAYRHALGATTSKFLGGLAEGHLYGRRCPSCERILVPARSFCDRCHVDTGDWFEVSNEGVIEMFTVVYEPFRGLPEPPYALAYLTPDGSDTALVGYVRGLDLSSQEEAVKTLGIGKRAKVVFAQEPTGTAADYWFELIDVPEHLQK